MRRFTKNCNLYDCAPELVKEWHPSANGTLTPRSVRIAYPRKVWWICAQSHEWQATIKTRLNGSRCPLCALDGKIVNIPEGPKRLDSDEKPAADREGLQTPFAAFELDAPGENLGRDFRKSRRFLIRTTAVFENPDTGHWFYADAKNFSAGGLGFESEAPVLTGTRLIIKLDRPLLTSKRMKYNSIVRWCRKLENEDETFSGYAIGAEYI